MSSTQSLVTGLLSGDHHALAQTITKIENREDGYRDLASQLHQHTGNADVIGITGSPGAGKSTLVDKLAESYRSLGLTVGIIAIDPSSPFTGGAVLGDRIRMASNTGDMDVFFRSMSARGSLGGLSTATTDAVTALDAFGKDKIIIETVGAGQNEVEIVRMADTIVVLVPPGSGDDVQMLKAGILEIADLFVVNKADLDGADRIVKELREMIGMQNDDAIVGHHGVDALSDRDDGSEKTGWKPPIIETIAKTGDGIDEVQDALAEHRSWLISSGELEAQARQRYATKVRRLLREDVAEIIEDQVDDLGGLSMEVDAIVARETDPYEVASDILESLTTRQQNESNT